MHMEGHTAAERGRVESVVRTFRSTSLYSCMVGVVAQDGAQIATQSETNPLYGSPTAGILRVHIPLVQLWAGLWQG